MVAMVRFRQHLHGRHMGGGSVVMLHRLQRMLYVRHSMGLAGLCEKLIGCDRLLMVDLRRDVARHVRVVGRALIMATTVKGMAGVTLMRLSQSEIFARRRRGSALMVSLTAG